MGVGGHKHTVCLLECVEELGLTTLWDSIYLVPENLKVCACCTRSPSACASSLSDFGELPGLEDHLIDSQLAPAENRLA